MVSRTRRTASRAFVLALLALVAIGCGDSSPTNASGSVRDAAVSVNPTSGSATTTFNFTALISTTGEATVTYQWERDTGELSPVSTLSFSGASAQSVAYSWAPGGCSALSRTRWVRVLVLTPNRVTSSPAEFTVLAAPVCT